MTDPCRILVPRPLTGEAFAPFGDVVAESGRPSHAVNDGTSQRFNDLARIEMGPEGRPLLSIFRCLDPVALPFGFQAMECHPLGSQAFLPRERAVLLVVVAPPGPVPEIARLEAFLTDGDQGINYRPGTWHLPLASLSPARFLVIDRGEVAGNCQVHRFQAPLLVAAG